MIGVLRELPIDPANKFRGQARLFELTYLVSWQVCNCEDARPRFTRFVVLSSVDDMDETYAFPADETGRVLNWLELTGSMKGAGQFGPVLAGLHKHFNPTA